MADRQIVMVDADGEPTTDPAKAVAGEVIETVHGQRRATAFEVTGKGAEPRAAE